jgi:FAD/FMN-containing dehydrogenase
MPALNRREMLVAAGLAAAGLAVSCGVRPDGRDTAVTPNEWTDLEKRLTGTVIRPGHPDFAQLATPRNLRFAATMPQAVVRCATVEDVVATLGWARKTNTPFAIRGGGHNYAEASSSRGIIVSTRSMNAATITGTALRAQAGVRNADLATVLPQGGVGRLLLPGGNCPAVGVAGLTLGGGIGPNAPWAGLTADRLRRATMVTAAGAVVTAGATENPDLFWALRGGAGGNLGVVTDLEYELVEVPVTRATTARFDFRGRDAAMACALAFQELRAEAERTVPGNLRIGYSPDPDAGHLAGFVKAQAMVGERAARDLFAPLLRLPGVKAEVRERPWWDVYAWYVAAVTPAYSFWDRSLYADDYLSAEVLGAAVDVVRRFPGNGDPARTGSLSLYGWVGGAVNDVAPDATAYVHRSAKVLVETSVAWATPGEPSLPISPVPRDVDDWYQGLWETLLPHTTGRSYQNFPDPGLADWAPAYYGDNLIRLTEVKAAWDPDGVFSHAQGIPPRR